MKRRARFLIATVLSLPFVLGAVGWSVAFLMADRCPELIWVGLIYWSYWILVIPWGAMTLTLGSISVLASWMQKEKSGIEKAGLALYSVAVLVHVGFVIWWYATGQVWEL